jgi:hypothetical protein
MELFARINVLTVPAVRLSHITTIMLSKIVRFDNDMHVDFVFLQKVECHDIVRKAKIKM